MGPYTLTWPAPIRRSTTTAPSASTHALYGRDRPVSAALLGVLKLSVPSGKRISDATIFEAVQGVAGDPDRTRAARLLSKEASEELASLLQYVCFPSYDCGSLLKFGII